MFTLCMSRGGRPAPQDDAHHLNNGVENKQVKCGYLLRYRNGFFCARWAEEYFVLYEDSTLEWFSAQKGVQQQMKGRVHISDAPELVAVGEWTHQVPKKPHFPSGCHIGQLIALGSRQTQRVHWLIAQSPAEVNSWMTAISNTLPPPPHLKVHNKRITLTNNSDRFFYNSAGAPSSKSANCATTTNNQQQQLVACSSSASKNDKASYDADHTVLSGVAIDWGHGWGWGQSVAHAAACAAATDAAALTSTLYCEPIVDCGAGFDEIDWSSFADFTF